MAVSKVWRNHIFIRRFWGRLFFISQFLEDLFVPIITKSKFKNRREANRKKILNILDEGQGYPEIFSFSFGKQISSKTIIYLLFQTDILKRHK